ncbi:GreA/GreB family elongation factor [Parapedobacter tibetensis]|nr:GreA/GreB family elongation factor [Parapedobacter tibetensis]
MESLKGALLSACKQYVQDRITNADQAIAVASDAATDDTKSSAGDKFETTREMMQQEINRLQQLLAQARQMEQVLRNIDINIHAKQAMLGSLVETNHGAFFLSVSAGQLLVDGKTYFAVSIASPVGSLMLGKEVGEQFTLNQIEYQLVSVS